MDYRLKLTVNGKKFDSRDPELGEVAPDDLLIDFLHERGLTGTKLACGIGTCGSCKVAVQVRPGGKMIPVLACYARLDAVNGLHVTTVEGLSPGGKLHPLQQRFLDQYAFQCGYSTPGMLMAGYILIDQLSQRGIKKRHLDREIAAAMTGHICRCTGYVRYHDAIRHVIESWDTEYGGEEPLVLPDDAPEPTAKPNPSIWFRVRKRSRNDLKEKVLEGRFEKPSAKLALHRPMAWDACSGEVKVQVRNLRTGQPVRDLNLKRFLFVGVREIVFTMEEVKSLDAQVPGDALSSGLTVPLTVKGHLRVGKKKVPVSAEVAVTTGREDTLVARSREPVRIALQDLGLPVVDFAAEFGLELGNDIEFGLDHVEIKYTPE